MPRDCSVMYHTQGHGKLEVGEMLPCSQFVILQTVTNISFVVLIRHLQQNNITPFNSCISGFLLAPLPKNRAE